MNGSSVNLQIVQPPFFYQYYAIFKILIFFFAPVFSRFFLFDPFFFKLI